MSTEKVKGMGPKSHPEEGRKEGRNEGKNRSGKRVEGLGYWQF